MAAHNAQTKGKIAEAAIRLILDEGFGAATVVRIRAAAGASNGSFYAAFGTRDELFDHLLGTIEASHRPGLALAMAHPARSARDGLARLLCTHLTWMTENPARARLRDRLVQGRAAGDSAKHAPAPAWEVELLATWARPLMADGTIRPMPDALLHALVLGNADAVARHSDAVGLEVSADAMASVLAEAGWVAIRGRAEQTKDAVRADIADGKPVRGRKAAPTGRPVMPDLFAESVPSKA
jgi:AcrR family transcriptional regulator